MTARAASPAWLRAPIAVLVLAGVALAEAPPAPGPEEVARGIFALREQVGFSVVDAYAWRQPGVGGEAAPVLVLLSPQPLDRAALAAALDYRFELERQVGAGAFAELELDGATAAWRSARFVLPEGQGCSGCVDPRQLARARLRFESGRVRGRIDLGADETPAGTEPLVVELALDLAIESPPAAAALPAGGGEPAHTLELCRSAIRRRERAAARSLCLAPGDERLRLAEARLDERFFDTLRESSATLAAATLVVWTGRQRGDWAELAVELAGPEGRQTGRVFLHRTPAGWRFEGERLKPVLGD